MRLFPRLYLLDKRSLVLTNSFSRGASPFFVPLCRKDALLQKEFTKRHPRTIRECLFIGCGGGTWTSRPPGYEPDELPTALPRDDTVFSRTALLLYHNYYALSSPNIPDCQNYGVIFVKIFPFLQKSRFFARDIQGLRPSDAVSRKKPPFIITERKDFFKSRKKNRKYLYTAPSLCYNYQKKI